MTRPDNLHAITYLCTRVKEENENEWFTLSKEIGLLKSTINEEKINGANGYGNFIFMQHLEFIRSVILQECIGRYEISKFFGTVLWRDQGKITFSLKSKKRQSNSISL
jgi:hypothetical protein